MKNLILIAFVLISFSAFSQMKHKIENDSIVRSEGIYNPDADTYTYENGWREEVMPAYNDTFQTLGDRYYNTEIDSVTWYVIDKSFYSLDVMKERKIQELKLAVKELYEKIQWYLEMKRANDETIPLVVKDRLQTIRTKYIQVRDEINALQTVEDVIRYKLPYAQIDSLKEQLEALQ